MDLNIPMNTQAPMGLSALTNIGQPQQQQMDPVANAQQPDAASVSSDGSTKTVTASFKA